METTLPHVQQIEKAVLGSMLISSETIWAAMDTIRPDDLFDSRHAMIYQSILELTADGQPVDMITVSEKLSKRGTLKQAGGASYLAEVTETIRGTSTAGNTRAYVAIIKEKAILREVVEMTTSVRSEALDGAADAFDILDKAEQRLYDIGSGIRRGKAKPLSGAMQALSAWLEKIHNTEGGVTGIPTHISKIDEMTTGWQNGDLIILAARPSMGKSAFAARCAVSASMSGKAVGFYSLEMSVQQISLRLICSAAKVDSQKARTGRMSQEEWVRIARAQGQLSELPIFIDDNPAMNVMELRSRVRRLHSEQDLAFVVVDYLQLIRGESNRNSNREQEVSSISRSLKALARELEIPVMALSQLSREVEKRGEKRPILSDLRDSGSIEQDADLVAFLYRPEYYGMKYDETGNSLEGVCEFILSKQRNGPLGTVDMSFDKRHGTFATLSKLAEPYGTPADFTEARGGL